VTQSGDVPANLTKIAGDGQTTALGQAFATPLQVNVTDAAGLPLEGAAVTFTVAPGAGGASATFASSPAMPIFTDANGNAFAPALIANGVGGTFTVTASTVTASANALSVTFTLNNVVSSLAVSSITVGSAAGTGSVLLLSNGPWIASSNAAWLQLAAGSAGGAGSALIQFSYSANSNPAPQTGTLTIAGSTFTVTQAGANYVPVTVMKTLPLPGLNGPQGVALDSSGNVYISPTAQTTPSKSGARAHSSPPLWSRPDRARPR
jgi:hypothetical protein